MMTTTLTLKDGYEWRTIVQIVPVVRPRGSKGRSVKEKIVLELFRVGQAEGSLGCVCVQETKSPWGMVKEIHVAVGGNGRGFYQSTIGINEDHIQEIHKIAKRRPEGSYFIEIAA